MLSLKYFSRKIGIDEEFGEFRGKVWLALAAQAGTQKERAHRTSLSGVGNTAHFGTTSGSSLPPWSSPPRPLSRISIAQHRNRPLTHHSKERSPRRRNAIRSAVRIHPVR
jgi:hypothetical protein